MERIRVPIQLNDAVHRIIAECVECKETCTDECPGWCQTVVTEQILRAIRDNS